MYENDSWGKSCLAVLQKLIIRRVQSQSNAQLADSFVWNRHYNLGKFNTLSAWFKKEKSVSTITEVFV